jgi:hypothetical protein
MVNAPNVRHLLYDAMEARRKRVMRVASGKTPWRALSDARVVYARAFVYPRRSNAWTAPHKYVMAPDRGKPERLARATRRFASMEPACSVRPMKNVAMERSSKRAT